MKKLLLICLAAIAVLSSCNDYETYGDKKEKERNAISKFISDSSIVVISEDQFVTQGYVTNVDRNEFVKLNKSGVYMQIVRVGCGEKLKDGETANLCCRFEEFNIIKETYPCSNNSTYKAEIPDVMRVSCSGGTFSASYTNSACIEFDGSKYGNMCYTYGASVPAGWLAPLSYIKVGRPQSIDDDIARVRLIVPHSQGHTIAAQDVEPYYYEVTYQKEA